MIDMIFDQLRRKSSVFALARRLLLIGYFPALVLTLRLSILPFFGNLFAAGALDRFADVSGLVYLVDR